MLCFKFELIRTHFFLYLSEAQTWHHNTNILIFFSVWLSFGNISRLSIRRIRITFFKWLLMLVSHFKAHATLSGLRVSLVSLGLPLWLFKQALWGGDKVSPEEELRKVEAKVRYNTSAANGDFTVIRSSLDCGSSQCKAPCGSWSLGVFCWLRKCMKLDDGLFSSDTPWRNRKCLSSEIEGLFPFHLSSKKSSKFCHQIMFWFFFVNGAALHGMVAGMLSDLGLFHSVTEHTDYRSENLSAFKSLQPFEER